METITSLEKGPAPMSRPAASRRGIAAFAVVALLLLAAAAWRVSHLPLTSWDESRVAMSAYETMAHGNWVAITYGDKLDEWYMKPPLMIWALASAFHLFGYSELIARLPSLLFALATASVIFLFIRHVLDDAWIAGAAALGLVTTIGFYGFHAMTSADLDPLLVLCNMVSAIAVYKVFIERRPRWYLVLGISLGLGFMTKSLVGLMPAGYALLVLLATRRWRVLLSRYLPIGIGLCLLISVPWLVVREVAYEDHLLRHMFGTDIFDRATKTLEGHYGDVWFYYDVAVQHLGVWLYLGLFAGLALISDLAGQTRAARREVRASRPFQAALFMGGLSLFYFVAFSACTTKIKWYMLPGYATYFAFLGVAAGSLARRFHPRVVRVALVALVALNLVQLRRYDQAPRSGPLVTHVLFPERDRLAGEPIIVQGSLTQAEFTTARIYSHLQATIIAKPQPLTALLQRRPDAQFFASKHAERYARDPRLEPLRLVRIRDQKRAFGLFRVRRWLARRPARPAHPQGAAR